LKPTMIRPACVPLRSPPPQSINTQDHELPGVPTSFSASSHPKPSLMMLHQRLCFDHIAGMSRSSRLSVIPIHAGSISHHPSNSADPHRPISDCHWSLGSLIIIDQPTSTTMLVRCFVLWLLLLLLFIFFTLSPGNRVTNRRWFA